MSVVAIHASSVTILNQFPSGSIGINLDFELPDKTLKSSYIPINEADLAPKKVCFGGGAPPLPS